MPTDDLSRAVARMRSEGPESLSAKATKPPWESERLGECHKVYVTPRVALRLEMGSGLLDPATQIANTSFAAASRSDAPLLADTLHRLAALCECDVGELEATVKLMIKISELPILDLEQPTP